MLIRNGICLDTAYQYCDTSQLIQKIEGGDTWTVDESTIDHCLARTVEPNCKLQFSVFVLAAVVACNFIKAIIMLWFLLSQHEETFVTFGDALTSWLENPDVTTKNRCLMSKLEVAVGKSVRRETRESLAQYTWPNAPLFPTTFSNDETPRWHASVGPRRWTSTLVFCITALVITTILLGIIPVIDRPEGAPNPLTAFTFGAVNPYAFIWIPIEGIRGFVACVLLANLPQACLSYLYLLYNGLFTCMHLAHEYSGYGVTRKALRVTTPKGQQRTTYWLQLPYRYSIPLIVTSGVLHWLVSQSIFLVRVSIREDEEASKDRTLSIVGYSCAPMMCTAIIILSMLITVLWVGQRKLQSSMPLAGSCSVAIAAAAHRPDRDPDAAVLPVQWGAIADSSESGVGHCCFTGEEITEPKEGKPYAGYL